MCTVCKAKLQERWLDMLSMARGSTDKFALYADVEKYIAGQYPVSHMLAKDYEARMVREAEYRLPTQTPLRAIVDDCQGNQRTELKVKDISTFCNFEVEKLDVNEISFKVGAGNKAAACLHFRGGRGVDTYEYPMRYILTTEPPGPEACRRDYDGYHGLRFGLGDGKKPFEMYVKVCQKFSSWSTPTEFIFHASITPHFSTPPPPPEVDHSKANSVVPQDAETYVEDEQGDSPDDSGDEDTQDESEDEDQGRDYSDENDEGPGASSMNSRRRASVTRNAQSETGSNGGQPQGGDDALNGDVYQGDVRMDADYNNGEEGQYNRNGEDGNYDSDGNPLYDSDGNPLDGLRENQDQDWQDPPQD